MHCSEGARDDSAPWLAAATPPRFLPLVFCWISASCATDRKWIRDQRRPRRGNGHWNQSTTIRLPKREGGGGRGGASEGRTNRETAYEKLENGSGKNSRKVTTYQSWKAVDQSTGGVSIVGISHHVAASPAAAAVGGMESSGSSPSSSVAGAEVASTSGGGGGSGSAAPPSSSGGGGGGKANKKVCGVCGDRAKSYHFGGVSCDSCKAFFRRSVQNDAYKNFRCPYERRCDINVNSRKCCQYCRFHKCLLIGMETGWVMSEEERLQLLRQRMERKAKQRTSTAGGPPPPAPPPPTDDAGRHQRPPTPDESSVEAALGQRKAGMLRELVDNYAASLVSVPHAFAPAAAEAPSDAAVVSVFARTFERMTHFCGYLDAFQGLERDDRAALLRCGMIEACLIRAAFVYDAANDCWPDVSRASYRGSPVLRAADLRPLASTELRSSHASFNRALHAMGLDERTLMTLLVVALFSPDRPGLRRPLEVARVQESYVRLLRDYLDFRYGPSAARKLFAELLLKLPDLRQLNDAFTQSRLSLSQGDIVHFQHRYGGALYGQGAGRRQRRRSDGDKAVQAPGSEAHHPRASSAFATPTSASASPPATYGAFPVFQMPPLPIPPAAFYGLLPLPTQAPPPFFLPPRLSPRPPPPTTATTTSAFRIPEQEEEEQEETSERDAARKP